MMHFHQNDNAPVVAISNTFEAYAKFLSTAQNTSSALTNSQLEGLRRSLEVAGERTLLWLGDRKLVFANSSPPHLEYLSRQLGYSETRYYCPSQQSGHLSLDIVRDALALQQIVEYAGEQRTVRLVPYATTPEFFQLVEVLQRDYELQVLLPESPGTEQLWIRDYVETKMGFRTLVNQWLPTTTRLPEGYICRSIEEAAAIAHWFLMLNRSCIIKSNIGLLGLGQTIFPADQRLSQAAIADQLQQNLFLHNDLIIVEEYLPSTRRLSPSIELVVPPADQGQPTITHVCSQIFRSAGLYAGELVSRDWIAAPWYDTLAEAGLRIANGLQAMGYVGHFDIDTVVQDDDQLVLIEVNARRTGGTHVHELAQFLLGAEYLDRFVLISRTSLECGAIADLTTLLATTHDLLYPMQGEQRGVIVTHSLGLPNHEFGYVIVEQSTEDAFTLQQQLLDRVQNPAPYSLQRIK